jgi:hypothetical protein
MLPPVSAHDWLFCQMPTSVYAPKTITDAPAASPSWPSVMLTALLVPVITSQKSTTASTAGSVSHSMSRMNDTAVLAGVRPCSSSSAGSSESTPKTRATRVRPTIFALLRRPRLRLLATLM